MWVPPAAPITERTVPSVLTTMVGVMEDKGRLPGLIKFAGLGGTPKAFVTLGEEKSSISSFKMMPVCSDVNPAPKLRNNSNGPLYNYCLLRIIYIYILKINGRCSRDGHSVRVNNGDVRRSFVIRIIRHGSVKCRVVVSEIVVDFGPRIHGPFFGC